MSSGSGGTVTTPGTGQHGPYDPWQIVSIVASASSNFHFDHWSGDTSEIANINLYDTTVTMKDTYSIQANFTPDFPVITINVGTTYSVTYPVVTINVGTTYSPTYPVVTINVNTDFY